MDPDRRLAAALTHVPLNRPQTGRQHDVECPQDVGLRAFASCESFLVPGRALECCWTTQVDNDVSLDFADDHGPAHPQHYACLVDESDFDDIFGRIKERGLPYWADPFRRRPGEFNTNDGGRGAYWQDPNGHILEIITKPYGSGTDS
jgi:hypothetical protein